MAFLSHEARNNATSLKKRRPKGTELISANSDNNRPTLLDHFVKQPSQDDDGDVIMNGTVDVRDEGTEDLIDGIDGNRIAVFGNEVLEIVGNLLCVFLLQTVVVRIPTLAACCNR